MIEPSPAGPTRMVWTVAALVHAVADALASRFGACTVQGELSGFSRAASGHCYFTLKDAAGDASTIRCAMFRRAASLLDFNPADGQLVELRGRLAVYEPRGELQFVVEAMQRAGAGALFEQFLRLKSRLEAEGLFDAGRKRALPAYPRALGVVTSLGAAALHDVLTVLARRAPQVEVIVYPCVVQGADAPAAIVRAIELVGQRAEVDTVIVCRGGGSLEDLWAFNDERVVRAIARSTLPVVCGVGHETDVTLADLAADLRAPTPTGAAELAAPRRDDLLEQLGTVARRLRRDVARRVETAQQSLDRAALRLARPAERVAREQWRLDALARRLQQSAALSLAVQHEALHRSQLDLRRAGTMALTHARHRLQSLATRLGGLDPKQIVARGYALIETAQGQLVVAPDQIHAGSLLQVTLAMGAAEVGVASVRPK
ncbi:exodeoxyribonuclease VII large subunit [Piscinibacter sp.]|uniref:exodeoxyribonuclease VII large subunit n=1 Tax=Piscinibacter sp. TaxID=1903157 RepID=UPI00355AB31E